MMDLTCVMLGFPEVTPKLLQIAGAVWITAMLYRRPTLSIFDQIFSAMGDSLELRPLARPVGSELALCVLLAPLMSTDIRSRICSRMYAMDASLKVGAVIRSKPMNRDMMLELWRRRKVRGSYTRLRPGAGAEEEETRSLAAMKEWDPRPEPAFRISFGYVGVGPLVAAAMTRGWLRGVDMGPILDADGDVLHSWSHTDVLDWLLWLLSARRCLGVVISPPPEGRGGTEVYRHGLGWRRRLGKRFALWVRVLWRCCRRLGAVFVFVSEECGFAREDQLDRSLLLGPVLERGRLEVSVRARAGPLGGADLQKPAAWVASPRPEWRVLAGLKSIAERRFWELVGQVLEAAAHDKVVFYKKEVMEKMKLRDPIAVSDLMVSSPWSHFVTAEFAGSQFQETINVLESDVVGLWFRALIRAEEEGTVNGFLDSDVATNANAKGRSAAPRLKVSVRKNGALQTAGGLYPGLHWGRTHWNVADDPTRGRPLRTPPRPVPRWMVQAGQGDLEKMRMVMDIPKVPKQLLDFVRFVLLYMAGDVHPLGAAGRGSDSDGRGNVQVRPVRPERGADGLGPPC